MMGLGLSNSAIDGCITKRPRQRGEQVAAARPCGLAIALMVLAAGCGW
jgi:hypothetical protein